MGPMYIFGYPKRPTKEPGGVDPSRSFDKILEDVFIKDRALVIIGHLSFPQSIFPPLHNKHRDDVFPVVLMVSNETDHWGNFSVIQSYAPNYFTTLGKLDLKSNRFFCIHYIFGSTIQLIFYLITF